MLAVFGSWKTLAIDQRFSSTHSFVVSFQGKILILLYKNIISMSPYYVCPWVYPSLYYYIG